MQTLYDFTRARPADKWHEDCGNVLWWHFPVQEPPHCGSPLDSDWTDEMDSYYTHFTQLPFMVFEEPPPNALSDVIAERRRQVEAEGWTAAHDDAHLAGTLARAGGCYALWAAQVRLSILKGVWPFDFGWWKPTTVRRDLVKAAALIIAEIERLDRSKRETTEEASP